MQAVMCIQGPVDEDDEWSEDDYDGNVETWEKRREMNKTQSKRNRREREL